MIGDTLPRKMTFLSWDAVTIKARWGFAPKAPKPAGRLAVTLRALAPLRPGFSGGLLMMAGNEVLCGAGPAQRAAAEVVRAGLAAVGIQQRTAHVG